jgi:predicted GNAT family acetyltransferase
MGKVVDEARENGRKLRPSCSYAVAYFQRHRDTADVQA